MRAAHGALAALGAVALLAVPTTSHSRLRKDTAPIAKRRTPIK